MPAYVIFIREHTNDPQALAVYSAKAPGALAGRPIRPLAMYGAHEVLEGPAVEGAALLEFPSFEEARAWYYSPAYQEAVRHRLQGARTAASSSKAYPDNRRIPRRIAVP
ncbi:DUF1330 domain-containing protein [Paenibacillus artemisiicola]|uniref:DUF1330 domain-containing protein n=1 Tax=Paenibacillus artemisiicola TaxID=1172618 RepID=UPI001F0A4A91|nr:DUF1330 domain-containing protein [Paenibacillus artemisiicola]